MKIPKSAHSVGRQVFSKFQDDRCLAGCTNRELRSHIEGQFKEGMSWDNYGEWEIDHITPVAFFDLTKVCDFLACVHFSNLQPLWKKENIRKRNRVSGILIRPRTPPRKPLIRKYILPFDPHAVFEQLKIKGNAVVLEHPNEISSMDGVIRRNGFRPIHQKRLDGKVKVGIKEFVSGAPAPSTFFECGDWGISK